VLVHSKHVFPVSATRFWNELLPELTSTILFENVHGSVVLSVWCSIMTTMTMTTMTEDTFNQDRLGFAYHSNHFGCKVDRRPEVRVDNEEQKPECNAAPDCQMCELLNNATHVHSMTSSKWSTADKVSISSLKWKCQYNSNKTESLTYVHADVSNPALIQTVTTTYWKQQHKLLTSHWHPRKFYVNSINVFNTDDWQCYTCC